jgi:hypothetical protein
MAHSRNTAVRDRYFPRPGLAQKYVNEFAGNSITRALILFGPLGIGKTTFLKRDLAPLAAKSGWVPVTIDLSALHGDPGTEIADRLRAETRKLRGARQEAGMWTDMARDIDASACATRRISWWMSRLAEAAGQKRIMLLLDEVQTLTLIPEGDDLAACLRAGMQTSYGRYAAIFTGSDRARLDAMFRDLRAPLWQYGYEEDFPPLGRDFSDALCERYERARGCTIDHDEAWEAFRAAGFNPAHTDEVFAR